jgi:uncharacterized membrane-anchored protein YitT (DUF2179 family)
VTRLWRELMNLVLILLGILCAGMGLKGFLLPSNFIDGGVTGVSMLLAKVTAIDLAVWLPLVNVPFVFLGYRRLGFVFALRSALGIAGLSLVLAFFHFPDVTPDPVLTSVFGGFFIGAGIGLAIRGGAVLDGTEIAALIISQKSHLLRVGDVILAFNIVLFLAAITLLGVQPALYSILTYIAAARTLDFVIYGLEEFTAVMVISRENVKIREKITGTLGRGVTVLRGYGGHTRRDQDILYCVVTRLEVGKVKEIAYEFDPRAFITIHALAEAEGGVVKRALH